MDANTFESRLKEEAPPPTIHKPSSDLNDTRFDGFVVFQDVYDAFKQVN